MAKTLSKSDLTYSKGIIEALARDAKHLSAQQIAKGFVRGNYVGSRGRSFYSILSVVRRFRAKQGVTGGTQKVTQTKPVSSSGYC